MECRCKGIPTPEDSLNYIVKVQVGADSDSYSDRYVLSATLPSDDCCDFCLAEESARFSKLAGA